MALEQIASNGKAALRVQDGTRQPLLARITEVLLKRNGGVGPGGAWSEHAIRAAHLRLADEAMKQIERELVHRGMGRARAAEQVTAWLFAALPSDPTVVRHEVLRYVRSRVCYDLGLSQKPKGGRCADEVH